MGSFSTKRPDNRNPAEEGVDEPVRVLPPAKACKLDELAAICFAYGPEPELGVPARESIHNDLFSNEPLAQSLHCRHVWVLKRPLSDPLVRI